MSDSGLGRVEDRIKPWIWLAFPGVLVHELLHAGVARSVGADVEFVNLDEHPRVIMRWDEPLLSEVLLAHLAPTLIGTPVVTGAWMLIDPSLNGPEAIWVGVNIWALCSPSRSDLAPLRDALRGDV